MSTKKSALGGILGAIVKEAVRTGVRKTTTKKAATTKKSASTKKTTTAKTAARKTTTAKKPATAKKSTAAQKKATSAAKKAGTRVAKTASRKAIEKATGSKTLARVITDVLPDFTKVLKGSGNSKKAKAPKGGDAADRWDWTDFMNVFR